MPIRPGGVMNTRKAARTHHQFSGTSQGTVTVGGAQVSEKHAGFVINTGNATCADVQELIRRVQEAVYRAHGVRLEPEVRFVGE